MRGILLLAAAVILAGCGGAHGRKATSPEDSIGGFNPAPKRINASFAALNRLAIQDPEGLRAAALERLASKDPNVRYAAVYALSLTATPGLSLQALRPILHSPDVTERVLAAETLVAQRDKTGVPVLIGALGSDTPLAHWGPPRPAWQAAQRALLRFVPEDLGLARARTLREAVRAKGAWTQWWAHHANEVRLKASRIGAP